MRKKKVLAIIGARPQVIKHFSMEQACEGKLILKTIHTGQHYDDNMSKVFFDQLGMRKPDYMLSGGGGNHGEQTGRMMAEIERIVLDENPDVVLVYGDTNTTLAGALVASKLQIPVAHIESGLRSYNREMPEEINRVLTDHISTWLFTPGHQAVENLKREGIEKGVYEIGDVMKDLVTCAIEKSMFVKPEIKETYVYVTLHRPNNVDNKERLSEVLQNLNQLDLKVVFALHPRTRINAQNFGINLSGFHNIVFIEPQPYFQNLGYIYYAEALITDSGGMQKEAYWMKKRCITVRKETEWLETLAGGANQLIYADLVNLKNCLKTDISEWDGQLYGDGNSCQRIVEVLAKNFE